MKLAWNRRNDVLFHLDLSKIEYTMMVLLQFLKECLRTNPSHRPSRYNNIKARGAKSIAKIHDPINPTELCLSANKMGTKYYERPVKKPISTHLDSAIDMPVYTTEGTAAIVSAMEENCVLSLLDLSMNHIDTECERYL